jgi:hypothetical protein
MMNTPPSVATQFEVMVVVKNDKPHLKLRFEKETLEMAG